MWLSSKYRFGRMENDIEVVTELTHSSCRVVGLGLCKPVLFPSFFVLELMLMSLWNKFLNCSCCFSHYIEISLLEHFTWFFYIICLNEIQPLSDGESCHECVCLFEDVCLFLFALTAFTSIMILELIFGRGNGLFLDCLDCQRDCQKPSCRNYCCLAGFLYLIFSLAKSGEYFKGKKVFTFDISNHYVGTLLKLIRCDWNLSFAGAQCGVVRGQELLLCHL